MFSGLKNDVNIIEVGPRDGLQNESLSISVADKLKYIELLAESGLKTIEATSFVRADKIPQMADADEVYSNIISRYKNSKISFPCLVPNLKGYELAKSVGVKEIALFSATSDAFTKANINCTIDESFVKMREVVDQAKKDNVKIRAYISTAFGCPYSGEVTSKQLSSTIEKFLKFDIYEISIGDTIGVATPRQVYNYIEDFKSVVDLSKIAMHFHDTKGMALSNTLVSLEQDIYSFDSSSGGLGGCPYAKGSAGNVATEDLIYLFESLGINTGVDLNKVVEASKFILNKVNKETSSKFLGTLLK